jgi:hypothetical protein
VDEVLRYRGRIVTSAHVAQIQALLAAQPRLSRRALSFAVCAAWDWRQPNGTPCDAICRGLLLALHRAGHIVLPPAQWTARRPARARAQQPLLLVDTTPVETSLRELGPLEVRQVRRTPEEPLLNSLLAQYHYLGYQQPVGEHLKYLVSADDRPIACATWSSAPRHLHLRDRFIGWSDQVRHGNVRLLAANTRFLILPWVRVPHLASHLLGRLAARISADWEALYAHPIYLLETFIDHARFAGTCYRAANWIAVGSTRGRGHRAWSRRATKPVKALWVYPLTPRFRERLGHG